MATPFSDFVIPDPVYLVILLSTTGIVGSFLYAVRPNIRQSTVVAIVPWIISGAALHVFYQIGKIYQVQLYPSYIAPLFSAPSVYLTMFINMGLVWILVEMVTPQGNDEKIAQFLGVIGVGVMIPLIGLIGWQGLDEQVGPIQPVWPILGLIGSFAATFVVYTLVGLWRTSVLARARYTGGVIIFAHMFDGITTTIGVDILGTEERSQIPRTILDFAADLPTAETIGTGWLFILVKTVLAVVIVVAFADYISEKPTEANLLLVIIAAVGLGPAAHNFLLFSLGV